MMDLDAADECCDTTFNNLSERTKYRYINTMEKFLDFAKLKNANVINEDIVIEYFKTIIDHVVPKSFWGTYSMLRSTLLVYEKVDIKNFTRLSTLLRDKARDYQSKTLKPSLKTFTQKEIETFMNEAPDEVYLLAKVVVLFALAGGCKCSELVNLKTTDIEDHGKVLVVHIQKTDESKARSFIITNNEQDSIDGLKIYKKYTALRPPEIKSDRLFLCSRFGERRSQPAGKNTIGKMSQVVAKYLQLEDPQLYTAHCFRRTAVKIMSKNHSSGTVRIKRRGSPTTACSTSNKIIYLSENCNTAAALVTQENEDCSLSSDMFSLITNSNNYGIQKKASQEMDVQESSDCQPQNGSQDRFEDDSEERKNWLNAMRRDGTSLEKAILHCCQDHFNIEKDTMNYLPWSEKLVSRLLLKPNIMPYLFECQKYARTIVGQAPLRKKLKMSYEDVPATDASENVPNTETWHKEIKIEEIEIKEEPFSPYVSDYDFQSYPSTSSTCQSDDPLYISKTVSPKVRAHSEFHEATKRDALILLQKEVEKLVDTVTTCKRSQVERELKGFESLFERFLDETGPSVEWDKIQKLADNAIRDYNTLEQPSDAIIHKLLNKLVVVKLNGGLGTSMGCHGPKSVIPVRNDLNFLDLTVQQIEHLNKTYDVNVPLVLMNSFNTNEDTEKIIRKYKNLQVEIHTFNQSCFPRISKDSLMPVAKEYNVQKDLEAWYPPGHGDFYKSFQNSGLLKRFIENGREYCFISNIDNLGATVDLSILDLLLNPKDGVPHEFVMEVTDKTRADVKGGTLIQYEDKLRLLEIAQVPKEHVDDFKSVKTFKFFNTNNLWAKLDAIERVLNEDKLRMEIIINNKSLSNGLNVIQLETAVGAAMKSFEKAIGINVPRSRFLPVKKTSDLLLVMSNLYSLKNGSLVMSPQRMFPTTPLVKLGDNHFSKVKEFLSRFANIPDLIELDHLTVSGDVTFGRGVSLKGTVIIIANHGDRIDIPSGANLENKIVSGNMRILDH